MVENILLLTIDSLREDHFPLNRSNGPGTPTFDELASEGTMFDRAFATGPGTTCSFPALLTGTLPLSYDGLGPLTSERPRVSLELRDEGLETAAFHSNPFLSDNFNYHIGFDTFEDYQNPLMGIATSLFPRGIEVNNSKLKKVDENLNITGVLKKLYQTISGKSRPYVGANVITDDVISWLKTTGDGFFCWAHYMDVHHPCFPPEEIRCQFGLENVTAAQVSNWYSTALESPDDLTNQEREQFKQLYNASIVYTDQQIGRIVDYLKSVNRWDETLVVLTSDHGELFGEYDSYGKPIRMYDELLRVPLVIVNGPSYLNEMRKELISLIDIPPIFHDVLDFEIPPKYEGELPDGDSPRDYVLAEHQVQNGIMSGASSGKQIYEHNEIRDKSGVFEVGSDTFDVVTNEHSNDQLKEAVSERLDSLDTATEIEDTELDSDVEQRLAELGYR